MASNRGDQSNHPENGRNAKVIALVERTLVHPPPLDEELLEVYLLVPLGEPVERTLVHPPPLDEELLEEVYLLVPLGEPVEDSTPVLGALVETEVPADSGYAVALGRNRIFYLKHSHTWVLASEESADE